MKITKIETVHLRRPLTVHAGRVQYLWVRIHTDAGLVGLGETYPHPAAEKAVIHASLAPILIGRNPLEIDRLWADMFLAVSYCGWAGAEMRAISAIDIARWDLAGKAANLPVFQLLGGASRNSIRIYNTCYDKVDFLREPCRLAEELLDNGVKAMKIWPFDGIAKQTHGQYITPALIRQGVEPLRQIRERFGDEMEVAMEFHGYWNLPSAVAIAKALEPYSPMWIEEILPQDNLAAYRQLASATSIPALRERAPDDSVGISGTAREPGGTNRHAGSMLVRRIFGGEKDCDSGGNALSADCAAQLRRADAAHSIRSPRGERYQSLHSRDCSASLRRRVPRTSQHEFATAKRRTALAKRSRARC
jgi:Mandelate racemase / muconate lactonizing enzyme, N-terminal domain/Enolase C-terminal domain-like